MSDDASLAFQDYATSGAFQISLTRNQVACLSMGEYDERLAYGSSALQALLRKGLLSKLPAHPDDGVYSELRPTIAGLHVLKLCGLAGLTNAEADPITDEVAALKDELERARQSLIDERARWEGLNRNAWSLHARLQKAELALADARRELENRPAPEPWDIVRVTLRDPQPDRSTSDLMADFEAEGDDT